MNFTSARRTIPLAESSGWLRPAVGSERTTRRTAQKSRARRRTVGFGAEKKESADVFDRRICASSAYGVSTFCELDSVHAESRLAKSGAIIQVFDLHRRPV